MNDLLHKEYRIFDGFRAALRAELYLIGGWKRHWIAAAAGILAALLPFPVLVGYRIGLMLYLIFLPQGASLGAIKSGWNRYRRTLPHPAVRIVNARHLFYLLLTGFYVIWIPSLHTLSIIVHDSVPVFLDSTELLFECAVLCCIMAVTLPFTLAAERFDKVWLLSLAWAAALLAAINTGVTSVFRLIIENPSAPTQKGILTGLLIVVLFQILSWLISRMICCGFKRKGVSR